MKPPTLTAEDLQSSCVPDGLEYLNSVSTPTDDHQDAPEEEPVRKPTAKTVRAEFNELVKQIRSELMGSADDLYTPIRDRESTYNYRGMLESIADKLQGKTEQAQIDRIRKLATYFDFSKEQQIEKFGQTISKKTFLEIGIDIVNTLKYKRS